ncbi:NAD-dependent epimerase/dehydratase family protein [Bradyrhizobium sp. ISRA442]|uniref:NAD-dependent epimerase/dehydratase family protein n=1 Tax=Bradyrhizobium sp. ISRA442 TaxID=2866197 RepID=UPI00311ACA4F
MSLVAPNIKTTSDRVLVTGGCGFLGCNIAASLAARGHSVLAMDNLSRRGSRENADWLRHRHGNNVAIEVADTRDTEAVDALVSASSAVMHLAAQVAVTTSLADPISDFEVNGRGTLNVLEAIRRHNPRAPVIFASTNKVYGKLLDPSQVHHVDGRYVPDEPRLAHGVGEDTPLDLYSPYGCSKGAADQYVRDYARVFELRSVVLRMSCIYGPRQFGNEDQGWIAHFLLQAIQQRPITIYGDGHQVRDALFVDDAVNAWIGALDNIDEVPGRIFNLGGGPANAISLWDLLEFITELRGNRPDVRLDSWRPGDQPWYVSDVRAASQALNWKPLVPVRQGLQRLERWLDGHVSTSALSPELLEARI